MPLHNRVGKSIFLYSRAGHLSASPDKFHRVVKSIFLYSRAGHLSASADKFHLGARVHKNRAAAYDSSVF